MTRRRPPRKAAHDELTAKRTETKGIASRNGLVAPVSHLAELLAEMGRHAIEIRYGDHERRWHRRELRERARRHRAGEYDQERAP